MKCLISAHDAGGAEVVSAWVRRHPENQYIYALGGPALAIFQRKLACQDKIPPEGIASAVEQCDFVLTGTSASSELETTALARAREKRIPSAAFLDYWWGFRQRFERGGGLQLPDEFWVGDAHAFEMARADFPGARILLKDNPYLLDIAVERTKYPPRPDPSQGTTVLYLSQPINEMHVGSDGRTTLINDYQAVKIFLDLLATGYPRVLGPLQVRIRPHPSENAGKYAPLAVEYGGFPVTISEYRDLAEDCAHADWAVGVYTMALVVAMAMGMKAFHCLPIGARPFASVIPYPEIRDFRRFLTTIQ